MEIKSGTPGCLGLQDGRKKQQSKPGTWISHEDICWFLSFEAHEIGSQVKSERKKKLKQKFQQSYVAKETQIGVQSSERRAVLNINKQLNK